MFDRGAASAATFFCKGKEPISHAHVRQTMKHPQKVLIWGCISRKGFGRPHIVDGTVNAEQYKTVLMTKIIPQAAEWF